MRLDKALVRVSSRITFSEVFIWVAIVASSIEVGANSKALEGWYHAGNKGGVTKITYRVAG
jgi:hypothetical protein